MGFSGQEYWSGLPLPSPSISITFTQFGLKGSEGNLTSQEKPSKSPQLGHSALSLELQRHHTDKA